MVGSYKLSEKGTGLGMHKHSCGSLFVVCFCSPFSKLHLFSHSCRERIVSVDSEDAEDPSDRAVNTSCLWQMDGSEQKCQVREGAAFPQDKERGPCVWHVAMAFCKGGSCCRVAQEAKWLSCLFQQGFTALVGKHFIKMLKCWFIRPLLACMQNLSFRLMLFNLLQMFFFIYKINQKCPCVGSNKNSVFN